jgi:PKD repeat protein
MIPRTHLAVATFCAIVWFASCSSGLGKNRRNPGAPAAPTSSANLPVGLDLGLVPSDPIAEPAIAGVVVPAIGTTAAREVVLLGFSTAARSDDGDGAGTPLARETTTDTNGVADIFVAAISAQDIEPAAFSQSLAGKFRHPRCMTCHSMQVTGTLAFAASTQPHAGPLPGPTFPNNDPATCAPCHVTSTNFPVEGWQAPAASFDIRSKTVAQLVDMAQRVPAGETEHFVTDRRVLWALDSGVLPAVNGRNGIADDNHDGVLEPEDSDGVIRTVPGGSAAFLRDIEAWHAAGDKVNNADAVLDVTLVSHAASTTNAANGTSTAPRLLWVPNPSFNPTSSSTAAATNPIGTLYVAFQSTATDLVGSDTNGAQDVFRAAVELRAEEDASGTPTAGALNLRAAGGSTILVSAQDGGTAVANGVSGRPSIGGAQGQLITFESLATDLVTAFTDTNGTSANDVYLRDTSINQTTLISHSVGNATTGGTGESAAPSIDATGVVVAFESAADDLIALDANSARDIYFARVDAGSPYTKVRASVTSTGAEGTGGDCSAASVYASGAGRVLVAFESAMTNLATVSAATNVFLFDSTTGHTTLLNQRVTPSATDAVSLGDGDARAPIVAPDGATVAFESDATNLDVLRTDSNRKTDVFLVEVGQLADGLVLPYRFSVSANEGGDGNGDSTRPVMGVFTDTSNFQVGFAAYSTTANNLGTSDSTSVMVTFLDETSGVIVNFTADTVRGPIPLTVQFTDQSSGNPTNWAWDFDNDGNVDSTEQNPTHIFTTAGTFTVKLVASNANTDSTKTVTDMIRALGPVVPSFTTSTVGGPAPLSVTFTDTSTEEPHTWAWDFENDGNTDSTVQNPTHVYSTPGTYTVKLVATNEAGSATVTETNLITAFTQVAANFSGTPLAGLIPLQVDFTDLTTGDVASWAWDFDNDGNTDSTAQNPSHTYSTPGSFTVVLTATGPGGTDTETKVAYVVVSGPVVADFSASATREYDTTSIQFTDLSTGTISTWAWDFDNDGNTDSTAQNPTHTFSTPGTYSVKLSVSGTGGSDFELKSNFFVSVPSSVSVTLDAAKDTSIYSETTNHGNGASDQIVAGNAASLGAVQVGVRRALVEFDVAGTVPAGATILTSQLQLTNTFAPTNPTGAQTVAIHRVNTEWGEGPASGAIGGGVPAQTGDATWADSVLGTPWGTSGGDFEVTASASTSVNTVGAYTWTSATVITDTQLWLDTPGDNHGWIVRCPEVSGVRSAKVFGSRTFATGSSQPKLAITYRPAL